MDFTKEDLEEKLQEWRDEFIEKKLASIQFLLAWILASVGFLALTVLFGLVYLYTKFH